MSIDSEKQQMSLHRHRTVITTFKIIERYRVLLPIAMLLIATAALVSSSAINTYAYSSIRGIVITTDTAPLEVASKPTLAVLGYADFGATHLYVTAESFLTVAVGTILAYRGGIGTLAGIVLGVCAAGMLVFVTGCPCGAGSTTELWQLVY